MAMRERKGPVTPPPNMQKLHIVGHRCQLVDLLPFYIANSRPCTYFLSLEWVHRQLSEKIVRLIQGIL